MGSTTKLGNVQSKTYRPSLPPLDCVPPPPPSDQIDLTVFVLVHLTQVMDTMQ